MESVSKVREDILQRVEMEKSLYSLVGRVVLNMRGCDIDMWLEDMSDVTHFPDELMIYALSRTYNWHTLIVCKERNWSTIESNFPLEEEELLAATHVKLVYLGNSVFGELKSKPYSQEVSNLITTLQLATALSKIRGKGRPHTHLLNLVLRKDTISMTDDNIVNNTDDGNLDITDSGINCGHKTSYTTSENKEMINLGLDLRKIVVPNQNLVTECDTEGGNKRDPPCATDEPITPLPETLLENTDTGQDTVKNMTGSNAQPEYSDNVKVQNEDLQVDDNDSSLDDSSDFNMDIDSSDIPDEQKNVQKKIYEMWATKAEKDPGFVHLVQMSKLDIYDMTCKPVKWSEIDPYSSLEPNQDQETVNKDNSDRTYEKVDIICNRE